MIHQAAVGPAFLGVREPEVQPGAEHCAAQQDGALGCPGLPDMG